MKLADVFQLVACFPNVSKARLHETVLGSLARLEQAEPGVRTQYLRRLAARARHHKTQVETIAVHFHGTRVVDLSIVDDDNRLRDFYHAVYYAGFFVGRYALVINDSYDCGDHKVIDGQLKTLGSPQSPIRRRAVELATKLEEWRQSRDVADYIMSEHRLEAFATGQVIEVAANELDNTFAAWSVP